MNVKDTKHGYVIVCLYVDDMLIVDNDDKMITSTNNMLNSRSDMKDLMLYCRLKEKKKHHIDSF